MSGTVALMRRQTVGVALANISCSECLEDKNVPRNPRSSSRARKY